MTNPLDTLIATAAPYGFTLDAAGPASFYLSRQLADGRAVTIGNTDSSVDGLDPLQPLFYLGGIAADQDMWDEPSVRFPDPMLLAEALEKGQALAMETDAAMPPNGWRLHFPSYPVDAYPPVPSHWDDASWRNDGCPSVDGPYGFKIWINWPDPSDREDPEQQRFMVEDTSDPDSPIVFQSNDWDEIESYIDEGNGPDEADWTTEE